MPQMNPFGITKEPFSEQFLKEPFFFLSVNNIKNLLCTWNHRWH